MNVLAFAASNSTHSINRTLASYAANLIEGANVEMLDINDYEMPIFSDVREAELGQPEQAKAFYRKISKADALVISFAEHNGTYTAAYKNLFDWTSRIDGKVFQHKPAVFLSTSPGPGGAASVLASAVNSAPYFAADLKANVSVPSFHENFDLQANEISNHEIRQELREAIQLLQG
ncbi:MAG: NADPH-dependent FMN reductase [SAR86 cluster bacterium]|uniref:NADPH-dependent FMN reductase n=1 Tax=SAR86 cluster bacterium TaxID=2030880 RepID=A0A2A5B2C9_9GAMM|nr:MAG: NADPH-dependent FMN reductase [SAR86 cluster bacterium]